MSLRASCVPLALLFLVAAGVRIASFTLPVVEDLGPPPYFRSLHFVEAAHNVREGRGAVIDEARVKTHARAWDAAGSRLPPAFDPDIEHGEAEWTPFYDEMGYLLLTLGLAEVAGGLRWLNVLVLQAFLSAAAALGVWYALRSLVASEGLALLGGWIYALHPLEILLARQPDHLVWGVYAAVAGLVLAARPLGAGARGRWAGPALLGAFLGFCVVLRATLAATAVVAIGAALWARGDGARRAAAGATAGAALVVVGASMLPVQTPAVGRTAVYHTLIGGMAEFGDIQGLRWLDASMHSYMKERYGVEKLTPAYNEAARREFFRILSERPFLPVEVAAKRSAHFLVAYRPGRNALPVVVAFGAYKVAFVVGCVLAWRRAREPSRRRRVEGSVAVVLAPVVAHVPLAPLLWVYIAPSLVLGSLPAALGTLVLLRELWERARGSRAPADGARAEGDGRAGGA